MVAVIEDEREPREYPAGATLVATGAALMVVEAEAGWPVQGRTEASTSPVLAVMKGATVEVKT